MTGQLEIEGPEFGGRCSAVLVAQPGHGASARFQVIPELGGKLLDVVVTPERVVGYLPVAGHGVDHVRGRALPRSPLIFIAASLLEELTPLEPARVLDGRRTAGGGTLRVAGALDGVVIHRFNELGVCVERRYNLGGTRWREIIAGDEHTFVAAGGRRWHLSLQRREPIDTVPSALLRLELPAGTTR